MSIVCNWRTNLCILSFGKTFRKTFRKTLRKTFRKTLRKRRPCTCVERTSL